MAEEKEKKKNLKDLFKKKVDPNAPKRPKDMTMEEFKAWCAANEARDAKEDKSNDAIMVANSIKLYGSEPDGYCINDYKEYFTDVELAEINAARTAQGTMVPVSTIQIAEQGAANVVAQQAIPAQQPAQPVIQQQAPQGKPTMVNPIQGVDFFRGAVVS